MEKINIELQSKAEQIMKDLYCKNCISNKCSLMFCKKVLDGINHYILGYMDCMDEIKNENRRNCKTEL